MRDPNPNEEYVIVVDNKRRESVQRVEYLVTDVRGETIYVTTNGLTYASDSLSYKGQDDLLDVFDRIPTILANPDIVVEDYQSPNDTRLYYKRVYVPERAKHGLLCVVVKIREGIRYLYNFFEQQSGKVKGYGELPPPNIWYIAVKKRPRHYGLSNR